MSDAACRGYDTNMFFPVKGTASGKAVREIKAAKAVCARCPVLEDCRRYILDGHPRYEDDYGIYAGMTPEDRHRERFRQRAARQRERRLRKHEEIVRRNLKETR